MPREGLCVAGHVSDAHHYRGQCWAQKLFILSLAINTFTTEWRAVFESYTLSPLLLWLIYSWSTIYYWRIKDSNILYMWVLKMSQNIVKVGVTAGHFVIIQFSSFILVRVARLQVRRYRSSNTDLVEMWLQQVFNIDFCLVCLIHSNLTTFGLPELGCQLASTWKRIIFCGFVLFFFPKKVI